MAVGFNNEATLAALSWAIPNVGASVPQRELSESFSAIPADGNSAKYNKKLKSCKLQSLLLLRLAQFSNLEKS